MTEHTKALVNEYKLYVESSPPVGYQEDESSKVAQVIQAIAKECLGDPTQYHGEMYVSPKLKTQSKITCRVAVLATWINILTAVPAFHFGFANLGVFGLLLTGTLSGASLKWSNAAAAAAAAATQGNRLWSNQGLLFFAAINIVLTAISGIGSELLTNQVHLSAQLAKEKIDQLKPDATQYDKAEERCNQIQQQLSLQPSQNERNRLIVEADGTWEEREKDWSKTSKQQIPVCVLAKLRHSDPAFFQWQAMKQKRNQIGNDVEFLKKEQPHLYQAHFTSDGAIKDGAKAFELAFQSFFGRLLTLNFSQLGQMGFSLLVFSLSVVTSAGACLMLASHASSHDTQISHNQDVHHAVLAHLQYLRQNAELKEDNAPDVIDTSSLTDRSPKLPAPPVTQENPQEPSLDQLPREDSGTPPSSMPSTEYYPSDDWMNRN